MKKMIQLNVAIINWEEPNKVTFDLKSMNEKLNGNGYFVKPFNLLIIKPEWQVI